VSTQPTSAPTAVAKTAIVIVFAQVTVLCCLAKDGSGDVGFVVAVALPLVVLVVHVWLAGG
jgi:hypothetical protein